MCSILYNCMIDTSLSNNYAVIIPRPISNRPTCTNASNHLMNFNHFTSTNELGWNRRGNNFVVVWQFRATYRSCRSCADTATNCRLRRTKLSYLFSVVGIDLKELGGSAAEMSTIFPRDWSLRPIFTQKWASADMNWRGSTPNSSNPVYIAITYRLRREVFFVRTLSTYFVSWCTAVFMVRHLGTSATISPRPPTSLLGFVCILQTVTSSLYGTSLSS